MMIIAISIAIALLLISLIILLSSISGVRSHLTEWPVFMAHPVFQNTNLILRHFSVSVVIHRFYAALREELMCKHQGYQIPDMWAALHHSIIKQQNASTILK